MSNETLLQTAWQCWHAGTGIDTEDMPPPNPSFKAGFDYGMVAAHNEHCAALIRVKQLESEASGLVSELNHKIREADDLNTGIAVLKEDAKKNALDAIAGVSSMSNAKRTRAAVVGFKTADGVVHLKPIGFFDPFMTLCGDCDVMEDITSHETDDDCTCRDCLATFSALQHGLRRAKS